jgi:signal transduction histidine kinase
MNILQEQMLLEKNAELQKELSEKKRELEHKNRELEVEAALEKVRLSAMAMHTSIDVGNTTALLFSELDNLGIKTMRCGIIIGRKEEEKIELWTATSLEQGKVIQVVGEVDVNIHPLLKGSFDAWLQKKDFYSFKLEGINKDRYYQSLATSLNYTIPVKQIGLPDHFCTSFLFSEGGLFAFTFEPFSPETISIFKKFTVVFSLTYRRYIDLKQAEARTREAQIEAALERVRSRTMSMQNSNELPETAAVVFKQLIVLGIAPNRLYIGIIKDESDDIEFWMTDEDGTKVSKKFKGNANRNDSVRKMYNGCKEKRKSISIDITGEELKNYFHYMGDELHVPFTDGIVQKRRVQTLAYFSNGFIGVASPEVQPNETTFLLERFAAVFNLTYIRYNDLKLAEYQEEQAQLDLIKILAEKKRAEDALKELKAAQAQLIQSEKMASLGELTSGIAHEIQNPLNFINNFSEVSAELMDEMNEELDKGDIEEAKAIATDIKQNLEKINYHGKRTDAIVKGMLQHSRSSNGIKEPTNINVLTSEFLRLAYHGLKSKDNSFNTKLETEFDEKIGTINIIPGDMGRVILNLITNAFYAVNEKKKLLIENYEPTITVTTSIISTELLWDNSSPVESVKITVRDNGTGIPANIKEKIFQPFFTTKPTGQGTGLGLSLSYDIVKAHGGELKVESKVGEGSEFIIQLPLLT